MSKKLLAESLRRGAIERYPNGVVLYYRLGMYVVSRGAHEHWHSFILDQARQIARAQSGFILERARQIAPVQSEGPA